MNDKVFMDEMRIRQIIFYSFVWVYLISWGVMVIWELIIWKTVRNTVRGEYFSSLTFGDSSIK